MTTAQEALAEGLAALDEEHGETYTLAATGRAFVARLERNRPTSSRDAGGMFVETVLHAQRAQAAFATLPESSAIITRPGGAKARLARIDAGDLPGMIILVLAEDFT